MESQRQFWSPNTLSGGTQHSAAVNKVQTPRPSAFKTPYASTVQRSLHQQPNSPVLAERNPRRLPTSPVLAVNSPLVEARSLLRPSSPLIGTRSPIFGAKSPLVGAKSPLIGTRSPIFGANSPLVGAKSPLVGAKSPLIGTRSPILGAKSPLVGAKSPLVGAKSLLVGAKSPLVAAKSPLSGVESQLVGTRSVLVKHGSHTTQVARSPTNKQQKFTLYQNENMPSRKPSYKVSLLTGAIVPEIKTPHGTIAPIQLYTHSQPWEQRYSVSVQASQLGGRGVRTRGGVVRPRGCLRTRGPCHAVNRLSKETVGPIRYYFFC